MATTYAQMQEEIRLRLDQRTDLGDIIYRFTQSRVAFWQKYFFYASDTQDYSISTQPQQIYYNLPGSMRNVRMVRLLLGNTQGQNGAAPTTTTTADVTPPLTTILVASTTGFTATGAIFIGGQLVGYGGITTTSFTGCVVAGLNSQNNGNTSPVISAGAQVVQAAGVWLELQRLAYNGIYEIQSDDVVQPPNMSIPGSWAQFGTTIRLYPAAGSIFKLELTGNASPPAPVNDADDNFWTEPSDAGALIVADTVAHVFAYYLAAQDRAAPFFAEAKAHKYAVLKQTFDLGGPKIFRAWGPGFDGMRGGSW